MFTLTISVLDSIASRYPRLIEPVLSLNLLLPERHEPSAFAADYRACEVLRSIYAPTTLLPTEWPAYCESTALLPDFPDWDEDWAADDDRDPIWREF